MKSKARRSICRVGKASFHEHTVIANEVKQSMLPRREGSSQ
jgi:hypothetical protein